MSAFRDLHKKGKPFTLANVWDEGSAKLAAALGAQALGTTSAGFAFTKGLPDDGNLTRNQSIDHAAKIVNAVNIPVSADLENGFGKHPEDVALTVQMAFDAGLAGCTIEDTALPEKASYDFDLAVARIQAGVETARGLKGDFVFTARADGIMIGTYGFDEALTRLRAFDALGADCLYAPSLKNICALAQICAETNAPVNALVAESFTQHSMKEFADAGAARLSLGSALARHAIQAIKDGLMPIITEGRFDQISDGMPFPEINELLAKGSAR